MAVPKLCAIAVLLASAVAVRQIAKTDAEGTHQALVREREHVAQNTTKPKHTWRPRGLSKSVISRVISRVTPFRVLTTLLITHLLSPLGLQARPLVKVNTRVQ